MMEKDVDMDVEPDVPILMVDDRPENLAAFEQILAPIKLRIDKAGSGREALRCLLHGEYALILMDVQMPEMDGYETARLIRLREKSGITPIIFITAAEADAQDEQVGYAVGAVDFLYKPVQPPILRAKVGGFVELFRMNRLLKDQAEQLRRASEAAEQASRAKSDFLANMSHELRTPLNSIIGFSEVLEDGMVGPLNEKQRQYLEKIMGSSRHLLELINDILDLSKVEAGKMELAPTLFPLAHLLRSSLDLFREKALKHGIELGLDVAERLEGEIKADERRMKQILFNLLSNAVKFTPDGGKVRLAARRLEQVESDRYPAFVGSGPVMEVEVEDTGIGIKAEDMEKLFGEFSRIETPYTRQYEGTGLGLALTRRLVQAHGGAVRAESEFGKGSRFSFILPLPDAGGQ